MTEMVKVVVKEDFASKAYILDVPNTEKKFRCEDCGYYYQDWCGAPDPDEAYPRCHYSGPEAWAPCNQEEAGHESWR